METHFISFVIDFLPVARCPPLERNIAEKIYYAGERWITARILEETITDAAAIKVDQETALTAVSDMIVFEMGLLNAYLIRVELEVNGKVVPLSEPPHFKLFEERVNKIATIAGASTLEVIYFFFGYSTYLLFLIKEIQKYLDGEVEYDF